MIPVCIPLQCQLPYHTSISAASNNGLLISQLAVQPGYLPMEIKAQGSVQDVTTVSVLKTGCIA